MDEQESFLVFRKGKWIQYKPRIEFTNEITNEMKWMLASAYGTAICKGFSEDKAHRFAEIHLFKNQFPDLFYSAELEAEYKKLFW